MACCKSWCNLVTSRNESVRLDPADDGMEIEVFQSEDGASLLLALVGCESYSEQEREAAHKLSSRLGGFALVLAVMAS